MEGTVRHLLAQDWITVILIALLILFAIARIVNQQRFYDFITLGFSGRYFTSSEKNQNFWNPFNLLLIFTQFLIVPIVLLIFYSSFQEKQVQSDFWMFLQLFMGYLLFFSAKHLLIYFITSILKLQHLRSSYHLHRIGYLNYFSLLLLLFCYLFYYAFNLSVNALQISAWVLGGVFLILLINIVLKYKNPILRHPFYFILYFCALEIAPYYILYKVFVG